METCHSRLYEGTHRQRSCFHLQHLDLKQQQTKARKQRRSTPRQQTPHDASQPGTTDVYCAPHCFPVLTTASAPQRRWDAPLLPVLLHNFRSLLNSLRHGYYNISHAPRPSPPFQPLTHREHRVRPAGLAVRGSGRLRADAAGGAVQPGAHLGVGAVALPVEAEQRTREGVG